MKKQYFALTGIAILSSALILLADMGDIFALANLRAYDALFYTRAKITPGTPPAAPIVIAETDDRTFADKDFKIPMILWHRYFAEVIKGLADSGAKVIALDYLLPGELFDNMVPDYSRTWLRAFAYAKHKRVPLITGFIGTADRQFLPHSRYLQIIGPENLGLFNLTTDADDFIRRQKLIFPSERGDTPVYSFAYLTARAADPDISPLSQTLYINYLPPEISFPRYSLAEIYKKVIAKDMPFLESRFRGKIVIIGATDALNQDRHPTPLYYLYQQENRRTHGTEIVANVVNTILGRRSFSDTRVYARFLIYLVLALTVILFTLRENHRAIFISCPALLLVYTGISLICFLNYRILPLIPGIAVIILSQALSFSYRYTVIGREKRRIRSVFRKFLPREVISQLLSAKDADFLRGENRRLCLLFSDIRRFTAYSENKSPEEVVSRLNEYFDAMSAVVSSEGGITDKFLGDGLMAFFGAFDEAINPSEAGARAALNMLKELEKLNQKWKEQGQETFAIGIGLHTGEVKVGNIGSHNKMEYTVIGDAVNLASRLQDKTKVLKEPILISDAVYNDLPDEIMAEDKGIEEIRGRSPIRIYALRGWKCEV
ncbi:adenylate/guanylate cyclase domain-containing protein [Desulfococcaceae bacterium HSG8]|nr:adenylate/guanylate cyclase domain-containing protein [Desulfococcaceae bacterium HSG8]